MNPNSKYYLIGGGNQFSGNEAGTGGLVTFNDSNWMMSTVLAHQPHFINQPADVQLFRGYSLFPDRIGNFVAKPIKAFK